MSLSRTKPLKRTAMKTKRVREDWSDAEEKRGACRICGTWEGVELAHTVGKARQNEERIGSRGGRYMYVPPASVVPLCGPATTSSTCHGQHHAGTLDLLPHLDIEEQLEAVRASGGIYLAMQRLGGTA